MDNECHAGVHAWFEKCGIISDVRTHLRSNLVHALKDKDPSLVKSNSKIKSAKQYIYDFLIAEYLFTFNYAYTLSVFASEAPVLIYFDHYMPECPSDKGNCNKQKLQDDHVQHTLETLGINPNDSVGQSIVSEYANNDAPLLLCILNYIKSCSAKTDKEASRKKAAPTKHTHTDASRKVCMALDSAKVIAAKKKLIQQKHLFENSLKEREMTLKKQAILMEEQLLSVNKKLQQAQNMVCSIALREERLAKESQRKKEEIDLLLNRNMLLQENKKCQDERDSTDENFKSNLKRGKPIVKKKCECKEIDPNREVRHIEVQTNLYDDLNRNGDVTIFNAEKDNLTKFLQDQRQKTEQLTQHTMQLTHRLEKMKLLQTTLSTPSVQVNNTNVVISESSSTEDILQDARIRLKRLEEESLKADRFYYNCIAT